MNDKKLKELLQNPQIADVVSFVVDGEYTEALKLVEILMSDADNKKDKNLLTIMFLQLLALIGYRETAFILLEELLKNLKVYSKERRLCKRTLKELTKGTGI